MFVCIYRPPVGKATIIYKEVTPPILTGEESLEELRAGTTLAGRVLSKFCEDNPTIDKKAWSQYEIRCIMRGRGICLRRHVEN